MTRNSVLFECDHLRPVVQIDGSWRHVHPQKGTLTSECGAGAYRVLVELDASHTVMNAVFADEANDTPITDETAAELEEWAR